jgi:hypothetical protein
LGFEGWLIPFGIMTPNLDEKDESSIYIFLTLKG